MDIEGIGLILRDLSVVLKKEMFYGDSLLIEIAVPEWTSTGFKIEYRFTRMDQTKPAITALGHTSMVCFDYEKRKPVRVPAALLEHRFLTK
jgi:acyl-CoA thioesterase FadM